MSAEVEPELAAAAAVEVNSVAKKAEEEKPVEEQENKAEEEKLVEEQEKKAEEEKPVEAEEEKKADAENTEEGEKKEEPKKQTRPRARKPRSAGLHHPPYFEMIKEALLALDDKTGSSPYAIAKHMEEQHKDELPANYKKVLAIQLKNFTAKGKLVKIRASFKLATAEQKDAEKKQPPPPPAVIAKRPRTARTRPAAPVKEKKASRPSKAKKAAPPKPKQPKSIKGRKANKASA